MTPARTLAAAAAAAAALTLALPSPAGAEPVRLQDGGLVLFTDLGGGGALAGSKSDASDAAIGELELGAGWALAQGFRPEAAILVGLAPSALLGIRPGLRYELPGNPFFVRGALDFAAPGGSWRMRWLLGGAGAELRFTDLVGAFAAADLGIPIASKAGFALLVRAGVSFRL